MATDARLRAYRRTRTPWRYDVPLDSLRSLSLDYAHSLSGVVCGRAIRE